MRFLAMLCGLAVLIQIGAVSMLIFAEIFVTISEIQKKILPEVVVGTFGAKVVVEVVVVVIIVSFLRQQLISMS